MSDNNTKSFYSRNASGLVRQFRPYDVFTFDVLSYGLGLVLAVTPTFLGRLYPDADIFVVLTLGVLLSICNGLTYGLFAAAMPRTGGDYIYIGRTLHPLVGFTANWGFTWSQFLGLGVYAAWCVSDSLGPAFLTYGYTCDSKSAVAIGELMGQPVYIFGIGTALLGLVLAISLSGIRTFKQVLNALFLIAVAGTIAMLCVFFATDHEVFVQRFNAFMLESTGTADAYSSIIATAEQAGLKTDQPSSFMSAIWALPIGYWVFIGFTYSVYMGGEVKEPQKSQIVGIIGALLFGYIIYMLVMGRYYAIVGKDFNNAVAMLAGGEYDILPAGTSMLFFAGICTDNVFVSVLMSVSSFLWFYLLLFIIAQISVRNLFAWGFDRLMPEYVTRISSRSGSPWVAVLIVVALGELFLILHTFAGLAFINYISLFSVCFLICGVAAIVFPFRRKKFFESSPAIVQKRLFGIPIISLVGCGNVLLFIIVLYSALTNPGISGVSGIAPTIILFGIYLAGALYYWARSRYISKDLSLDLLFEKLPPE